MLNLQLGTEFLMLKLADTLIRLPNIESLVRHQVPQLEVSIALDIHPPKSLMTGLDRILLSVRINAIPLLTYTN